MPRRTILSDTEFASLLILPDTEAEAIRRYTFSDADAALAALGVNQEADLLGGTPASQLSQVGRALHFLR